MACAGDVPTLETLAAVSLLRTLRSRAPNPRHQRGQPHEAAACQRASERPPRPGLRHFFTPDKPIIFAFHGYPWLIHRLTYRRASHANLHVRGYKEEGTTTTPFDMAVLNEIDRFHLSRRRHRPAAAARLTKGLREAKATENRLIDHKSYISRFGDDMPEIRDWKWAEGESAEPAVRRSDRYCGRQRLTGSRFTSCRSAPPSSSRRGSAIPSAGLVRADHDELLSVRRRVEARSNPRERWSRHEEIRRPSEVRRIPFEGDRDGEDPVGLQLLIEDLLLALSPAGISAALDRDLPFAARPGNGVT